MLFPNNTYLNRIASEEVKWNRGLLLFSVFVVVVVFIFEEWVHTSFIIKVFKRRILNHCIKMDKTSI